MEISFSDFAKLLHPYCGKEENRADFVITLTDRFVLVPGRREKDGYINPVRSKDVRTRYSYFSGDRSIPPKVAHKILGRSSKNRFEEFIKSFSDNAQLSIAKKLIEKGVSSVTQKNVDQKCADIFQAILEDGKYEE